MRKLPYVRQGQLFTTDMLNSIIKAINDSIVTQPDYQQMMNDLAAITNQYTSKIDSFIAQYKDVVDNTPTLLELLKAYAELKSRTEEQTSVNGVLGSIKFNFVYNPNSNDGTFPPNGYGYPDVGNVAIKQGDAVIVSYPPNQEGLPDKIVFVLCSESVAVPNWLSLDVVVGPQGPEGAQGVQGAQGTPGKNGVDGKIINIRGELQGENLSTINIQEQLTQIESTLALTDDPLKVDDAFIYDNIKDPQIFVYVGKDSLYHSSTYDNWSIIRNIRGPEGPVGTGTKVELGYSVTSKSEIFTRISKDTINKYYFLCIRTTEPGSEAEDYVRIRFRQPETSYTPELNWSYTDTEGKSKTYKEINNEGLPFSLETPTIDITETVEKKLFQLNLEDIGEITEADINEEGQLVFKKKYKHVPDTLNPKVAEIKTINNVKKFIKVDDTIIPDSTNPVQSKVIQEALTNAIASLNDPDHGKADLVNGKIKATQLPGSVGKIIEGTLNSETKFTANDGKIYGLVPEPNPSGIILPEPGSTFLDKSKSYGWSGSKFVQISASLTLGETDSTAYAGNKGKQNASDIATLKTYTAGLKDGTNVVKKAEDCTGTAANATTATKVSNNLTLTLNGGDAKIFNGSSAVSLDITADKIGSIPTSKISITPTEGKEGYVDKAKLADYATDAGTLGTHVATYFATADKVQKLESSLNTISETATAAKSASDKNTTALSGKLGNKEQAADSKLLNGKEESALVVKTAGTCTGNADSATKIMIGSKAYTFKTATSGTGEEGVITFITEA